MRIAVWIDELRRIDFTIVVQVGPFENGPRDNRKSLSQLLQWLRRSPNQMIAFDLSEVGMATPFIDIQQRITSPTAVSQQA